MDRVLEDQVARAGQQRRRDGDEAVAGDEAWSGAGWVIQSRRMTARPAILRLVVADDEQRGESDAGPRVGRRGEERAGHVAVGSGRRVPHPAPPPRRPRHDAAHRA